MSPLGFSILVVGWPMHSLLGAKQAGAQLPVHVVTVQRRQGINAGPGIPQVRSAGQVQPPRADGAEAVVHQQRSPNARQGVAQLINAEWAVRQAALVKQEPLLYNRNRSCITGSGTRLTRIRDHEREKQP
jgi:hypothetical protein